MATLTWTELKTLVLDRCVVNVTIDNPLDPGGGGTFTLLTAALNRAYMAVWEESGGAIQRASSTTAWALPMVPATGVMTGILTGIKELEHVFYTSTYASTGGVPGETTGELSKRAEGRLNYLRNASGFPNYLVPKVYASRRLYSANVAAQANLIELLVHPVPAQTITPITSVVKNATTTITKAAGGLSVVPAGAAVTCVRGIPANCYVVSDPTNSDTQLKLNVAATDSFTDTITFTYSNVFIPIHYEPQFLPLTGSAAATEAPNVNDLESVDIGLMAAAEIAPTLGRAELVMSIVQDMSAIGQKIMMRKMSAVSDAMQNVT